MDFMITSWVLDAGGVSPLETMRRFVERLTRCVFVIDCSVAGGQLFGLAACAGNDRDSDQNP